MSQHDFSIANQTASSARADINNALQALASNNSGSGAPSTTYANMLWYETDTNLLKMRNEGNTAWLNLGYIDQSDGLEVLDNTKVVNTSGTQTGLLGDQTTGTWQAGTGTTDSLVSPADIKAAILALATSVGVDQSWQSPSRSASVSYRNTTGKAIQVAIAGAASDNAIQVSSNGSSWITVGNVGSSGSYNSGAIFIVPDDHYYRLNGGSFSTWSELR